MNEIITTLALPRVCFIFLLRVFLREMLEAVDIACLEGQSLCDLSALHGLRKCVHQQQIMGER